MERKCFPVERGAFPCLRVRVKCFKVGGGNISLLEGEMFPCWRGKRFSVGAGNLSLLEGEMFPC